MSDPSARFGADESEARFIASVLGLATVAPLPHQLADISDYLAGIEAAVNALPACDPVDDALDVGFDPGWPEEQA